MPRDLPRKISVLLTTSPLCAPHLFKWILKSWGFWPFLFASYWNKKVLKHVTSAECIYISHCEFLLNTARGMNFLLQCFGRLNNAFEEILSKMLMPIIKICHSKTTHGWLDRMQNWFETLFHHNFPDKDKLIQLVGKYDGTLVPTFCWSPRKHG